MKLNNQGSEKKATDKEEFGLSDALKILDGKPSIEELERLAEFYPQYKLAKRKGILWGYFEGQNNNQLISGKLESENIDINTLSKQAKGGHGKWRKNRVQYMVIRIMYLRYVHDEGLTRIKANAKILHTFTKTPLIQDYKENGEPKSVASNQSWVRKRTQTKDDHKNQNPQKSPATKNKIKAVKPHWSW